MLTAVLFIAGLVLLVVGAEMLVRGAARLAAIAGIPPLIVGLTVVAFGTSAPELAVSVRAGFADNGEIALGNVVGSNIANILLILGLSALVAPLVVKSQLVRLDVPLMILAAGGTWLLCLNGTISRLDGAILTAGLLSYVGILAWLALRQRRRGKSAELASEAEELISGLDRSSRGMLINLGLVVAGLLLLVGGAQLLVNSAMTLAEALGVPPLVVGLTIVAVGTSLPEIATSVMASLRGQRDIAVGNVVGSNIFNMLCVLGISAFVTPLDFRVPPAALAFDIPVMFAVCVVALPIFFTGGRISRMEGAVLLFYFIAYTLYLLLNATEHEALGTYSWVMLAFFLPLTVLGLAGSLAVSLRHARRRRKRLHKLLRERSAPVRVARA